MSQSSKNTVSQYERKFKSMILVSDLQVFDQVHCILIHWTTTFNVSVWIYIAYPYSLGLMMLVLRTNLKWWLLNVLFSFPMNHLFHSLRSTKPRAWGTQFHGGSRKGYWTSIGKIFMRDWYSQWIRYSMLWAV